MKVNVLYFGLIAEALTINTEELIIEKETSIHNLKKSLVKKHPKLEKLNYQIALNQKIANPETLIKQDSEIALLPPFAGG